MKFDYLKLERLWQLTESSFIINLVVVKAVALMKKEKNNCNTLTNAKTCMLLPKMSCSEHGHQVSRAGRF